MPDWVKEYISTETKTKPSDCTIPATGIQSGIMLSDLSGLDYNDELWGKYLNQLTAKDMAYFVTHCMTGTKAMPQYGIPEVSMADGPSGVGSFFGSFTSIVYPCEVVIASTFNDELVEQMGKNMGTETKLYNITVIWGPGLNMRRTAFGGRNFEYYSEDPLLAGKCAAAYTRGCQSVGTLCTLKHFALNDQEIYRCKNGLYIWASEQALREIYHGTEKRLPQHMLRLCKFIGDSRIKQITKLKASGRKCNLSEVFVIEDLYKYHGNFLLQ